MKYPFYVCDVFTEARFGGNPLAVVPDARGLTADQMQKIATEFNYSESTFVFPPEKGHTRRVRIFTPTVEVPFAGHPNVGTAFTLATIGAFGELGAEHKIVFEEEAGLVPIRIKHQPDKPIWCELEAPQTVTLGQEIPTELAAAAISVEPVDIVTDTHQPRVATVGFPFIMIELRSVEVLARSRANIERLEAIEQLGIKPDVHLYVQTEGEFDLHTRMFAPMDGVPEDPATGSANCALVAMLSDYQPEASGQYSWRIAQGYEMGRPSQLEARTEKTNGVVSGTWIGGSCVMVQEGLIDVG